ncbi:carboxyl methyl esterase [Scheffersomyces coipomensis]|uniref:carboxyl methyl esterase n=1 Tax=Scheffersomyces coipomensis TaxID=1788519 RepID=UPI00315DC1F6
MSDIQKALLKRIKQQEQAMGLSSLSEEADFEEIDEEDTPAHEDAIEDSFIIKKFTEFKTNFFDVIESYDHESLISQTYFKRPSSKESQIFVLIHGAGSSSMTFAKLATELHKLDKSVGIFIYDLRGHGYSSPSNDFSIDSLVDDLHSVLTEFVNKHNLQSNSLYIVGHSLGGAVMAKFLSQERKDLNVRGEVILDIVEETAVKSLIAMPHFIEKRPKVFQSISKAIEWHMNYLLFSRESANLSIPDLLNPDLTWKTDLALTQPAWEGWFVGLSKNFLSFKGPKLLILSAHETLDKNLIIGQMQGKYQLVVFQNNTGHFIHEDLPTHVAHSLLDFVKRNENPDKFMKDELGIVPKWGGKINK